MRCKVISDYTNKKSAYVFMEGGVLPQAKRMANNFSMGEAPYHLKQKFD
jgi:hypothetical protein